MSMSFCLPTSEHNPFEREYPTRYRVQASRPLVDIDMIDVTQNPFQFLLRNPRLLARPLVGPQHQHQKVLSRWVLQWTINSAVRHKPSKFVYLHLLVHRATERTPWENLEL